MTTEQDHAGSAPATGSAAGRKIVNLALQGGGSHGAFTWGVLDRLLEESRLEFEGVTGTSAGAVNAVVFADGLAAGGREGAKEALRVYWQKVSALSARGPWAPSIIDKANPDYGLEHSLGFIFLEPMTHFASPYQMNPLNINPFEDLLAKAINFERVRQQTAVKLFLCATDVQTAKVKIFYGKEIDVPHLLASTCLPLLMQAVEVEGEFYWDGGLVSNTPLQWVLERDARQDTLAFQVDLWSARGDFPRNIAEVMTRQKEIHYSSRTRNSSDGFRRDQKLRNALASLIEKLPEDLQNAPELEVLRPAAHPAVYNIVQLIYRAKGYEGDSKDYEFSRQSMEEHWGAGYYDTVRTLRHSEVLQRPQNLDGVLTFDLGQNGRE